MALQERSEEMSYQYLTLTSKQDIQLGKLN